MSNAATSDAVAAATVAAAAADAIDGRRRCCSGCRCCRGCHRCDNLRCLRVARSEGCYCCCRHRCCSASAAAVDGAGFPYYRLLRAQLTACLLQISVESINMVCKQRFGILKRDVDRSLKCHVIYLNLWMSSAYVYIRLFVRLSGIINGIER